MNKIIKVINSISYPHIVFTILTDEDVKRESERESVCALSSYRAHCDLGKVI